MRLEREWGTGDSIVGLYRELVQIVRELALHVVDPGLILSTTHGSPSPTKNDTQVQGQE